MNILHIAPIGHMAEGIGTVLMKLMPLQQALGHDVRIVSVKPNRVYDKEIATIIREEDFCAYINEWIPDIVVFHSVFFLPYLRFAKIIKAQQIPYLVQLHGGLSNENLKKGKLKKEIALFLGFKRFLKQAKTIVYLNQCEYRNSIVKRYNPNYLIIPNGCEQANAVCLDRPYGDIADIVYIGRIDMIHKGNDVLIEALRLLHNIGCKKFKLAVYANQNDPDLPVFKEAIADMSELVEYKGPIYGKDKDERLRKADMFILTSRYEGMPMGVLEALTYGVPCLLTPGTNMADEVVEAGAGWKAEFSAQSIADTILKAVDDLHKGYTSHHQSAYNLSKRYDWNVIAKQSVLLLGKFAKTK